MIARQHRWSDGQVTTVDLRTAWQLQAMLREAREGVLASLGRDWIEDTLRPAHRRQLFCAHSGQCLAAALARAPEEP